MKYKYRSLCVLHSSHIVFIGDSLIYERRPSYRHRTHTQQQHTHVCITDTRHNCAYKSRDYRSHPIYTQVVITPRAR